MRVMLLDIETLPEGAAAHRALMLSEGLDWRTAPPPEVALTSCDAPAQPERKTVPSNWRDPNKIARRQMEIEQEYRKDCARWAARYTDAAWDWWRAGSLRADRGVVHTACWSICGRPGHAAGNDERRVLADLGKAIEEGRPDVLVTWGDFDPTFIFGRAARLDLGLLASRMAEPRYSVTAKLKLYGRKPALIDAMDMWPHHNRVGPSMGDACKALGIDHDEGNPIPGAEVLDAYLDGREADILAHCQADVRDLGRVWSWLAGIYGIVEHVDGPRGEEIQGEPAPSGLKEMPW